MATRIVYGNSHSENGWPMVDQGSCTWVKVPGTNVSLEIQNGQPLQLLRAFAADWNAYIEPLRDADSACWTATNSVASSNHLSGTACDLNWNSHPFRVKDAGFNGAQLQTIRDILAFYEDTIFWGNDWDNPKDAMHVQAGYNTYNNPHTQDFINRKIRADGFSTFRRGNAPVPVPGITAETLAQVMGNRSGVDYTKMLQPYRAACDLIQAAGNLNRLAMFAAQIGHESGGLQYMEEIASGSAYEGRSDLGNTQPGDGVRFKGRGPLQITGRHNYGELSKWAFGKGLVPSPTFFVDQPAQLGIPQYGFLGACWYWVIARPRINEMCDAGDIVGVTKAINGGTNGLQDRTDRWNKAKAMGLAALDISGADTPPQEEGFLMALSDQQQRELYDAICGQRPSKSPVRAPGEGNVGNLSDLVGWIDGSVHWQALKTAAELGHPDSLTRLRQIATIDTSRYADRAEDAKLAQAILAGIAANKAKPNQSQTASTFDPPKTEVVYVDRPAPPPAVPEPVAAGGSTGQIIGRAYDALEELRLADALPIENRAPLAALIAVLQTKNGSQV